MAQAEPDFDVLIVGAGISGIAMAVHLSKDLPGKRFAIIERRPDLGGTWDLFQYPGIRSDSDMYTMSLESDPWLEADTLGQGQAIKRYLASVLQKYRLDRKVQFSSHVISADWRGDEACWHVIVERGDGHRETLRSRYLHLASGYYDYDEAYDAEIPGRESFTGALVHPQFWPKDLDYAGKRVVVIGSGATAITIVPAMAGTAKHVTMLQRTPTWIVSMPQRNPVIRALRAMLPERTAHKIIRWLSVRMQRRMYREARNEPKKVADRILDASRKALGDKFDPKALTPDYAPWDQRMCFVPDDDLFKAIVDGKASIVTDHIERIDETGIKLKSGEHIDADIIVTATGLKLAVAGKIAVSVDGQPVNWNEHVFYKGCMLSDIPNFTMVIVYSNASATLRSEIVAHWVCRLLQHMDDAGARVATPRMPSHLAASDEPLLNLQSGYLLRSLHLMPRNAAERPWRLDHDYLLDRKEMRSLPIEDGNLVFQKACEGGERLLEAAE